MAFANHAFTSRVAENHNSAATEQYYEVANDQTYRRNDMNTYGYDDVQAKRDPAHIYQELPGQLKFSAIPENEGHQAQALSYQELGVPAKYEQLTVKERQPETTAKQQHCMRGRQFLIFIILTVLVFLLFVLVILLITGNIGPQTGSSTAMLMSRGELK